jgi:hypothetical protein
MNHTAISISELGKCYRLGDLQKYKALRDVVTDAFRATFRRQPVNLYCTVNGILADWVKDAARVNVENGDFYGSGKLPPKGYGSIAVPHDWLVR